MNVAHLVIDGEMAGGQLVALQLARATRDAGHMVSFVSPSPGSFVERARSEGFAVHIVALRRSFQVGAACRLWRTLRRERVDVLHTHTLAGVNIPARIVGRAARAKVVSHAHIPDHFRPRAGSILRRLDNLTAKLCARVIAVSGETAASYARQGYPRDLLMTIPNGIAIPTDDPPLPACLATPAGMKTALCVARLCEVKGQSVLIQALRQSNEQLRALFVGADLEQSGAYEQRLRTLAAELGVDERVAFAGFRDDVAALLGACDVFVLPSHDEGMPMVVLEAMAHGCAIVATRVGGIPELIEDGVTGLLVSPGDPVALANAVNRLVDDSSLAAALGSAARWNAERRFSIDIVASRVLAVYETARQ